MVVASHATQAYELRVLNSSGADYWYFGTFGVDIFFVISGFVMYATTEAQPRGRATAQVFLWRRLIRVVPLYWLFTTLKILVVLLAPAASLKPAPDAWQILASYLFIPVSGADGYFWPILPVGWTLNFEMFFYGVFALALMVTDRFRIVLVLAVFLLFLIPIHYWGKGSAVEFYADSLLFEFVLGMCLARSRHIFSIVQQRRVLRHSAASFLFLLATVLLLEDFKLPRGFAWGVPAAALVAIGLLYEKSLSSFRISVLLSKLGDSSYSLYLSHTFVVPVVVIVLAQLGALGWGVNIVVSIALSIVVAEFSYRCLELPALTRLKRIAWN